VSWQDRAACRGQTAVMFPVRGESTGPALRLCAGCPVRSECAEAGVWEQYGVWGGVTRGARLEARKGLPERVHPIAHGTDAGYRLHRERGEDPCRSCVWAHSEANRLRRWDRTA
jgi:hypothetical protein